jgi:hypothetical protein
MANKYKVWECKIVVSEDVKLPDGFDSPPRLAAIKAVEQYGFKVLDCFSGWGGKLTKIERIIVERDKSGM